MNALLLLLQVQRFESCRIHLHGRSEFEANNVTLKGNLSFDVPNGFKMIVVAGCDGAIKSVLEPLQTQPSWQWKYTMSADKKIQLQMETASSMSHLERLSFDASSLSYVI